MRESCKMASPMVNFVDACLSLRVHNCFKKLLVLMQHQLLVLL